MRSCMLCCRAMRHPCKAHYSMQEGPLSCELETRPRPTWVHAGPMWPECRDPCGTQHELGRQNSTVVLCGSGKQNRDATSNPGHDPLQQSQWHRPQSTPHHGALLSSAEVRFKQGQHFLLLMRHVPVGVSTHSVSNANQLHYQPVGFLCASPAHGRHEWVRRGGVGRYSKAVKLLHRPKLMAAGLKYNTQLKAPKA